MKPGTQLSIFDLFDLTEASFANDMSVFTDDYVSPYSYIGDAELNEIISFYNALNDEEYHATSRDDICTPMECVKTMIEHIPEELWQRKKIAVLDPCCGNGNFGAYCSIKTNPDNIYYNELNPIRLKNCIALLKPKHWNYGDAFTLTGDFNKRYDLIMANPPYSGGGNKNQSLSNQFIEKAIDMLADRGYLCFVTPNNWMTYNNNNTTLKKLLREGSFIVIDNDAKKYFPNVGSSFTIIVWQKGVYNIQTKVFNNYLIKDEQTVFIPQTMDFIPLYLSQHIISITTKLIGGENSRFYYRCDLHNFTKKKLLNDEQTDAFPYRTIHTPRKTRYAKIKQDIYDKWIIIIPLSTYYLPYVEHKANTTQSVGYIAFETENEAVEYLSRITQKHYKLLIHLTRYGNFNNIMVMKHLRFDEQIEFSEGEIKEIERLVQQIKY